MHIFQAFVLVASVAALYMIMIVALCTSNVFLVAVMLAAVINVVVVGMILVVDLGLWWTPRADFVLLHFFNVLLPSPWSWCKLKAYLK